MSMPGRSQYSIAAWIRLLSAVLLTLWLSSPVWGQASYTAQIRGVVTDQSGAVVPKANVTITSYMGSDSVATGAVAGKYMLAILPNGSTVALIGGLPADPCYQGVEACIAASAGKSVPNKVPTPVLVVTKEKDHFASGRIGRNPA